MSTTPYLRFFVGDYLAKTMDLTIEQHGAYFLLILAYFENRGPLTQAQVDALAGGKMANVMANPMADGRTLLQRFFHLRADGKWSHSRLDEELGIRAMKVSAGRKGASVRWNSKPHGKQGSKTDSKPHGKRYGKTIAPESIVHSPDINSLLKSLSVPAVLNVEPFPEQWKLWVTYRRKKGGVKDWHGLFTDQLEELQKFGASIAAAKIKAARVNGWTGCVFEDKPQKEDRNSRHAGSSEDTYREQYAEWMAKQKEGK